MTKTVTVTSGKGGVGKTNLVVNMAMQLAAQDYRTCVFDADLGLANINIVCGLYPEHTVEDVVLRDKSLSDIIIKDYNGIDVIPGSSGVEKIANLDSSQLSTLISSFSILDEYDYLFFDTAAGVSKNVISFCLSSSDIICIITPEPTSLTDAYALLKILYLNGVTGPVKIVVNQCKNTTIARQTYIRFKDVVQKYLKIELQALGVVLVDPHISESVSRQRPFISLYPNTVAAKCIKSIVNNLQGKEDPTFSGHTVGDFWTSFVRHFTSRLNLSVAPSADRQGKNGKETVKEPSSDAGEAASDSGADVSDVHQSDHTAQTGHPPEQAEASTGEEDPPFPGTASAPSEQQTRPNIGSAQTESLSAAHKKADGAVSTVTETDSPETDRVIPENNKTLKPGKESVLPASVHNAEIYPLLEKLVNNLSDISEEISALRQSVQENGHNGFSALPDDSPRQDDTGRPQIALDFDTFVKNRTRNT